MLCACLFCLHLAVHVHFLADHIAPHPNWTLLTSYYHKLGKLWTKVGAMLDYKIEKSNSPLNNSCIWRFPKMVVPPNHFKSSVLRGFSSINHPFWAPPFMESPWHNEMPPHQGHLMKMPYYTQLPLGSGLAPFGPWVWAVGWCHIFFSRAAEENSQDPQSGSFPVKEEPPGRRGLAVWSLVLISGPLEGNGGLCVCA